LKDQSKAVWLFFGIPAFSIVHGLFVYGLLNSLVAWGYGNRPPADWAPVLFLSSLFVLNPLACVVGYADNHGVRLHDCWYYVSEIFSAVLWSTFIVMLLLKRIRHRPCTANDSNRRKNR